MVTIQSSLQNRSSQSSPDFISPFCSQMVTEHLQDQNQGDLWKRGLNQWTEWWKQLTRKYSKDKCVLHQYSWKLMKGIDTWNRAVWFVNAKETFKILPVLEQFGLEYQLFICLSKTIWLRLFEETNVLLYILFNSGQPHTVCYS